MKARAIRKSEYGDYFAVDYVDENSKIIETPLYLKKGEQKEIKIRWDFTITTGSVDYLQHCMEPGLIRFDGNKVEATYLNSMTGLCWFEPTEFELKNFAIIHFK